mmetsp:Transcript_25673/g.57573  ORF Transcript_25673/g.57573 Transcript_25673/m.57573 type:complete len:109 (+) Transcript_25673:64-390(+)
MRSSRSLLPSNVQGSDLEGEREKKKSVDGTETNDFKANSSAQKNGYSVHAGEETGGDQHFPKANPGDRLRQGQGKRGSTVHGPLNRFHSIRNDQEGRQSQSTSRSQKS